MNVFPNPDAQPSGQAQAAGSGSSAAVARLVIVITFLLIFSMAARTPLDTDMWWHLRAGEEILRTGRLLDVDIFSFTRAGAPWTNPYWLAQVGMALSYRWLGFLGLGLGVALFATLSMFLVYRQCEGPVFLKSAALLLGSVVASVVWSPRPQLLSLVWLALVGYLLYLYKWRGQDRLWALPLIFILWANTHGGYPLGLILIGSMLAGEVLNHGLGIQSGPVLGWRQILRLGIWAIACGLAVLVNPNGLEMWRLPFLTVNMSVLQQFIPEWASPDFHQIIEQSVLWLLLAVFAAAGLSGRRMDGSDLVTTLIFALMVFLARRNFGPFALVAVPVLTRYASAALQAWQEKAPWLARLSRTGRSKSPDTPRLAAFKKTINLALVALLALVGIGKLYVVTQPSFVGSHLRSGYPAQAVAWLITHRSGGKLFNEYNWGGYLQWALPGFPTFVDGRTDLFGDAVVGEWITVIQAKENWKEILSRYAVDLVMVQPDRPLLQPLQQAGWKLLYQDAQVVIYGRE